ncbi:MAG TPA: hypothetical protein VF881_07910 [Polyangiaceae bacterium]
MRNLVLRLAVVLAACGCSSSSSPGSPVGGDFQHDVIVSMQLTVKPGEELHRCQYVALPSDQDINVVAVSHQYSTGSHHFLVYTTDLDAIPAEMTGQYDCVNGDEPIMEHTHGILYGGQSPSGSVRFPDGVGFPMRAGQVLLLQAHYINPTSQDIEAKVSAGFDTAPLESRREEAGFMIFYDPFIYVPAQSSATSGIHCDVTGNVNVITAYTHYHQRGKAMHVWLDPSRPSSADAPFFETTDWEHPEDFQGPMAMGTGSVVRFRCDYENSDTFDVFQGPTARTSEMCVFAGLYYPRLADDFEFCANMSVTGTGAHACVDQLSCVQACPPGDAPTFTHGGVLVGPCWEKCVAMGCAGATDVLLPVSQCVGDHCAADCALGSDACTACATSQCATQISTCLSQTCP